MQSSARQSVTSGPVVRSRTPSPHLPTGMGSKRPLPACCGRGERKAPGAVKDSRSSSNNSRSLYSSSRSVACYATSATSAGRASMGQAKRREERGVVHRAFAVRKCTKSKSGGFSLGLGIENPMNSLALTNCNIKECTRTVVGSNSSSTLKSSVPIDERGAGKNHTRVWRSRELY